MTTVFGRYLTDNNAIYEFKYEHNLILGYIMWGKYPNSVSWLSPEYKICEFIIGISRNNRSEFDFPPQNGPDIEFHIPGQFFPIGKTAAV